MTHPAPRVLATRTSKTLTDTLEILCLERGLTKVYRLYTTTDEGLSETFWDLDPVEFNRTDESDLNTYLTESFWLTRISPTEIHREPAVRHRSGFAWRASYRDVQSDPDDQSQGRPLSRSSRVHRLQPLKTRVTTLATKNGTDFSSRMSARVPRDFAGGDAEK